MLAFLQTSSLKGYSQSPTSGTITYEKVINYDFKLKEKPKTDRDHRRNAMLSQLPKTGKEVYDLKFTSTTSLYSRNTAKEPTLSPRMAHMVERMSFFKEPKEELKELYIDLEKGELTRQVEFMTREFILESELEKQNWQLLAEKRMVMDYVCFGAQRIMDGDTIIAYFTSEIPVSVGPEQFSGLPGAILAIETNGKISMLAINIDLTDIEAKDVKEPKNGKKVSQKKFEKIKQEKIEEWQKMIKERGKKGRRHGGPGGPGRPGGRG